MTKKLLVSTLGTSPAVVTEALDLLGEEHLKMDGVILLTTQDPEVAESYDLLNQHLRDYYEMTQVEPRVAEGVYGDINSEAEAVAFMSEACHTLKTCRDDGYEIYACIAGGRKAMSALLALAVQFYGARRLFHIWAPIWLELDGEINELRKKRLDLVGLTKALHPTLKECSPDERPQLVKLPFFGLFSLLPEILGALQGQTTTIQRDLKSLLIENGLLTSQGELTELGKLVGGILEKVEGLPPVRQQEGEIRLSPGHHNNNEREILAKKILQRFSFVTRADGIRGESQNSIQPKGINQIILFKRCRTDEALGLRLTTTATTEGQQQAALKAIERWLEQQ